MVGRPDVLCSGGGLPRDAALRGRLADRQALQEER